LISFLVLWRQGVNPAWVMQNGFNEFLSITPSGLFTRASTFSAAPQLFIP
jgi:hypothetical protein